MGVSSERDEERWRDGLLVDWFFRFDMTFFKIAYDEIFI